MHVVFYNETIPTEIYTLPLPDALPIPPQPNRSPPSTRFTHGAAGPAARRTGLPLDRPGVGQAGHLRQDRKSTRLNSSHANISYAVFCLIHIVMNQEYILMELLIIL